MPEILARAIGQGTEYEEMIDAYIVKPNFYCVGGSVAVDAPQCAVNSFSLQAYRIQKWDAIEGSNGQQNEEDKKPNGRQGPSSKKTLRKSQRRKAAKV